MNAVIFHSTSKRKRSFNIASTLEGDKFEIKSVKKPIKSMFCQMVYYGYQTVVKKSVKIQPLHVNLDKYDEIYLVSPVWAGRINAYVRQFLIENPIKNKKIHIISSSQGLNPKFFSTFKTFLDKSNEVIEETVYIKGIKQ
jgi:hypothetical protein